jgi:hypothetical protein
MHGLHSFSQKTITGEYMRMTSFCQEKFFPEEKEKKN